jgi:type III secretory pathway component EscV
MKLPNILPPADLLKQIEGIESGLLQRKRLGKIGVAAAAVQIVVLVANNEWWQKLVASDWRPLDTQSWIFLSILAGAALSFLLIGWSKFWLKESEEPFRYTYSIAEFAPVEGTQKDVRMSLLSHDLSERLSERIRRLSLLSEDDFKKDPKDGGGEARPRSHIHIRGYYVLRENPKQQWFIEVMPRVRIGPPGSPETLAHAVKFKLKLGDKKDGVVFPSVEEYEKVLERVYFSVATEIYKQIQQDVQRKIALLPTAHYRAAAFFHEAEDYARSNTLDAYDEALKLYDAAMKLYDPTWKPLSRSAWRRSLQQIQRWRARLWTHERAWEACLWPRLGHIEVMCARAEIGYSSMLLYRRVLAGISGRRLNPVFEARRVAEKAVARLRVLPDDVPEKPERLFDAYVTLALAWCFLASFREGEKWLKCARQLHPRRTEEDARYLFATGELERQMRSRLQRFRLAVEVDPRFEVAHFSLALQLERLWRTRPSLEWNVAKLVSEEYEEILKLNPGNIGAWANLGYIRWLLGTDKNLQEAKDAYESGREYKDIKRETFVAELDYGLARIAAERGDFEEAYKYYVSAVSAHLAKGVSHTQGPQGLAGYMFEFINDAIRARFEEYKKNVEKKLLEKKDDPEPTERVRRSVRAFVINEYGEACYYYYQQSADEAVLKEVELAYEDARKCNPYYVMPHFNLGQLSAWRADYEQTERMIEEVGRLEPEWPEGILMMTEHQARAALDKQHSARQQDDEAEKKLQLVSDRRDKAKEIRARYGAMRSTSDIAQSGEGESLLRVRTEGTQERDWKSEERRSARQLEPARGQADEQIRKQAEELEEQARELDKEIEEDRKRAKDLRNQAVVAERKALEGLKRLLPHEWAESALKDLTGKDIPSMLSNNQIIWAKELEDIHVRALIAWARILSLRAQEQNRSGNGKLLPHVIRRALSIVPGLLFQIESALRERHATRLRRYAGKLLLHIREHFWPDDFTLHLALRDLLMGEVTERLAVARLDGELPDSLKDKYRYDADNRSLALRGIMFHGEREELLKLSLNESFKSAVDSLFQKSRALPEVNRCHDALAAVITGWIDTDPGAYWALCWVKHDFFDIEERKTKFAVALKQPQLSKYLIKWIGDELHKIGARDEALSAYTKAMEVDDARFLFKLATSLEDKNLRDEALRTYERARAKDTQSAYPKETYHRRIGRIHWAMNQHKAAFDEFDAIGKGREEGWRKDVVADVLPYIHSIESYRLLKSWLEREQQTCRRANRPTRDSDEALLRLVREKYHETQQVDIRWGGLSVGMFPVVTPVAIEADDKLFPKGEGWSDSHELFVKYIPEMRARIEAGMGVRVPGVRVRGNETDLPSNAYLIMLNEVPLVMGTVDPQRKFCPSYAMATKVFQTSLPDREQAPNPVTGEKDGAWVEEHEWKRLESAGVPLWDSFEYMTRHLESVLRDNLIAFVGFEEVHGRHKLLADWCDKDEGSGRKDLVNNALPDLNRRVRFVQVLQGLLKEHVPVTNLRGIIEAFQCHDSADNDVIRVVEAVRLVLRDDLPGARDSRPILKLSPAFEEEVKRWIRQSDGKTFFAIPPENTQELLSAMRAGVTARNQSGLVIATATVGIRPFVRRLIELEFPRIMVLSSEELGVDRLPDISGTIEYANEIKTEPSPALTEPLEQLQDQPDSAVAPAMPSRPEQIEVILSPRYLRQLLEADLTADSVSVRSPTLNKNIQDMFAMMGDGLFYELGIRVPEVFLTASAAVEDDTFILKVNHVAGPAQKALPIDQVLVNATAEQLRLLLPGIVATRATNPANNAECAIILKKDMSTVEQKLPETYSWEPLGYIILALSKELRQNAWRLLDREAVEYELAQLHQAFPELTLAVMESVSCEHVARVLVELLRDEISIRDLRAILERVLTYDYIVTDPSKYIAFDDRIAIHDRLHRDRQNAVENYVQYVRAGLKRPISHKYTRGRNTLVTYLLDPKIEERVIDELAFRSGDASSKPLNAEDIKEILAAVRSEFGSLAASGVPPVILTTSAIRSFMRKLIAQEFPALAVLAYEELSPDMNIQPIARISAANLIDNRAEQSVQATPAVGDVTGSLVDVVD